MAAKTNFLKIESSLERIAAKNKGEAGHAPSPLI